MPDPDPPNITITLTLYQAVVVLTSLHDATENPENTEAYKYVANELCIELANHMIERFPKWSRQGLGDLDEHGHYPGEFDP